MSVANSQIINIRFNGEERGVRAANVSELLDEFELSGKKVAVELNREIVPRGEYKQRGLSSGDSIEIVHFVGGG